MANQKINQYAEQLLKDLGLNDLTGKERDAAVEQLTQRFQSVVFNTTLRLMNEQEKMEYLEAAQDPEKNEKKIVELTSQVEGLGEGIEKALLYEYEALKVLMANKKKP